MKPVFRKSESLKPEKGGAAPLAEENPREEAKEATSDWRVAVSFGGLSFLAATIVGRMKW